MVHSHDDKFLMLFVFFLFFLNVLKRNRECVSEEGEAWSRVKKTSASVKKFKNYREWILGFRAKWKQTYRKENKKSWEMSSSLSRVNVEVSVSQALFPPLH